MQASNLNENQTDNEPTGTENTGLTGAGVSLIDGEDENQRSAQVYPDLDDKPTTTDSRTPEGNYKVH